MNIIEKMELTIKLAEEAMENGELPISAIIFLDDEIISKAYATEKTDKRFLVHAESKALLEADKKCFSVKDRKRMQLFTTLEPCMMCLGASLSFFIGEIYYALEAPMDGAVKFAQNLLQEECKEIPSYKLPKIEGGILREEAKELFKKYIRENKEGTFMFSFAKSLAEL
jgi:tRNA(adenine34) deaminase